MGENQKMNFRILHLYNKLENILFHLDNLIC